MQVLILIPDMELLKILANMFLIEARIIFENNYYII